jgi:serine/threonine protein kinase
MSAPSSCGARAQGAHRAIGLDASSSASGGIRGTRGWPSPAMSTSRPSRLSARPPKPSAPRAERVANRYVVKEELASGGMGIVYRVLDRSTGEERALKRLNRAGANEVSLVEAFEREYQVLSGLDPPHIIRAFDYGVDEVGPYYAMELLEWQDMRNAAPLPYRDACALLGDARTSLALLYARRLIHRDLSLPNVRMIPDGHCELIDFDALISFGSSRTVVGTPPTIPPEALQGQRRPASSPAFGVFAARLEADSGSLRVE